MTNATQTATRSITFIVPGKPMGMPRHRSALIPKKGGGFVTDGRGRPISREYTPEKATDYKSCVQSHAMTAMRDQRLEPFTGPVSVTIEAVFQLPKTKERKREPFPPRRPHTSKPDHDNIAKIICDACNAVVYLDDSQIAQSACRKLVGAQGEPAHIRVTFSELTEEVPA